jgi:hypothetical protein
MLLLVRRLLLAQVYKFLSRLDVVLSVVEPPRVCVGHMPRRLLILVKRRVFHLCGRIIGLVKGIVISFVTQERDKFCLLIVLL